MEFPRSRLRLYKVFIFIFSVLTCKESYISFYILLSFNNIVMDLQSIAYVFFWCINYLVLLVYLWTSFVCLSKAELTKDVIYKRAY